MKTRLTFLLLAPFSFCFAQQKLPVVHATSKQAKIIEQKDLVTDWNLEPAARPDVYQSGKNIRSRNIKFVTDTDSLEINLKPGKPFDFVVLLNGKDSCYTRFQSPELKNYSNVQPAQHDTIPFVLTKDNNLEVQSVLNEKDSLKLLFDSGAYGFYLLKTAIKKYLNPSGKQITMQDISDNHFRIENLSWEHQQVIPLTTTGDCCEGMFGWDAFDGKVVEIDYEKNRMLVHTKRPKISKEYEKFDIEYMKEHFCIQVGVEADHKRYTGRFLFDLGYQRTVMLDHNMMQEKGLPIADMPVIKESLVYNSRKEAIPLLTVAADKIIFGKYVLDQVPAQVNSATRPAGYATNFLGGEILKRFNIILDFQKHVVYLKPNHLFKEPYAESKKS
ncbi:MAG: hypothetical protein BGO31_11580 [Bacteroidetes bacterium 43-16]|nr:MAG: hypothetical protein BGO31_11580 [Bacteroidetes bacterium 43-16]